MDKVIRDGKVAVLYSPGFGAGWYTWNKSFPECMYHPTIVKMIEDDHKDLIDDDLCEALFKCEYFFSGGADDLKIVWLPVGTRFTIDEYDGNESIQILEDMEFLTA